MDFKELLLEGLSTLNLNKVRTGLAVLGVVIGIGSVISLISLGQSSQLAVENQIKSLGSNLLTVMPGAQRSGGIRGTSNVQTLTLKDAEAISNSPEVTTVENVSPEYSARTQVTAGRNNTNTQVVGVTPAYQPVRKITINSGNFFSINDINSMSKTAVLGPQTSVDLFGEENNPIGQNIRINNIAFRVIGLTDAKGGSGFQNQDDIVFIPLTTAQKFVFGADHLTSISIEAKSEKVMTEAQNQVGYLLLSRRQLSDPSKADFSIMSQEDILGTASQVTGTFTTLLSGIAAISLLVGGIGIMNIMLVTVTERTREIGLRKALGAKKKIITAQFLIEAIIITTLGGFFGIILGIIISFILSKIMSLPFMISPFSLFLATGVSMIIGILFGWYPARKAANLQPIEALRYE